MSPGGKAQLVDEDLGMGVQVYGGAHLVLVDNALFANQETGLLVAGDDTWLEATSNLVEATLPDTPGGELGQGVMVTYRSHATLSGNAIVAKQHFGLFAVDEGVEVEATNNLIADTLPQQATNDAGYGVMVTQAARAQIFSNAILANHAAGLEAEGGDVVVQAEGNLFADTLPDPDGQFGRGVDVQAGAQVVLMKNAIVGNHESGLVATASPTDVHVEGNLIENTLPRQSDAHLDLIEPGLRGQVILPGLSCQEEDLS